ncbi:MAG: PUR family DNA/RNA-binding protein [Prevotellaceae bacterium]|jgi:hypothetical protein|nr:PUR family DNA/RNA-binding protein [Prevotellaceae bacterium]
MEDIIFSRAIKAGKRIYYMDVKRNRKNELFLTITESKKIVTGEGDDAQVSFEKHKIFLYKEDFEKFTDGLREAVAVATGGELPQPDKAETTGDEPDADEKITLDIDFDGPTL